MIALEDVKLHLRVDHDDEDDYITGLIAAATAAALDYLNVESLEAMPTPVEAAILLQVGDLYANRERQAERPYHGNPTYERLLNPYRVMGV
jgi:uncharacterized phage protein (predicted DNA packaging)